MARKAVKYLIIVPVFAGVIAAVAWLHYANRPEAVVEEREEVPVNVVVMPVEKAPLPDAILLPASVEPYKSVTVSAEVPGSVDWIGVEEGERVEEGTAIARIDSRTLKAELDRAESALKLAESGFNRARRLFAENAISEDEFEQRKSQMEVARALHEAARIRFEKGSIAAPSAGILNRRYVEPGEYVNVGDPIADIVRVDRVKVVIDVPEKEITFIEVGEPLAVLTDAEPGGGDLSDIGEPFSSLVARSMPEGKSLRIGTVTYRSVVAAPGTHTYRVEVTVANPDLALLPGRIVRAVVLRRIIPDAISVPLRAILPREGRAVAYVRDGARAKEVEVTLGITDGRNIEVKSGLQAGDALIIEGQRQLKDGQAVVVREAAS